MSYIKTKESGISKRQLKNGSWVFYGSYRDKKTSKVIRKKIGGIKENITEAFEAKVKFRKMLNEETPIQTKSRKKITLEYVSELYFKSRYKEVRDNFQSNFRNVNVEIEEDSIYKEKKQAVRGEEQRFKNHSKHHYISQKDVKIITLDDVINYKDFLMDRKSVIDSRTKIKKVPKQLSTKTIHLLYSQLKRIWNYGIEMDIIHSRNILENKRISKLLKNPKINRKRVLTKREQNLLLDELQTLKEYNAFYCAKIALITGCRAKTVLGIKRKDIDLENCLIKLNNYKSNKTYEIPFSENYVQFFVDLIKKVKCEKDDYIIQPQRTSFYKKTAMRNIPYEFFQTCDKLFNSKLDKTSEDDRINNVVNFHTLRHTRASELAKHLSLPELKTYMNHSSLESTLIYVKTDTEEIRLTLNKLSDTTLTAENDLLIRQSNEVDKMFENSDEDGIGLFMDVKAIMSDNISSSDELKYDENGEIPF